MAFIVIRPMTYLGRPYAYGDVWEPQGARTDAAIIAARMVVASDDAPADRAQQQAGRAAPADRAPRGKGRP